MRSSPWPWVERLEWSLAERSAALSNTDLLKKRVFTNSGSLSGMPGLMEGKGASVGLRVLYGMPSGLEHPSARCLGDKNAAGFVQSRKGIRFFNFQLERSLTG